MLHKADPCINLLSVLIHILMLKMTKFQINKCALVANIFLFVIYLLFLEISNTSFKRIYIDCMGDFYKTKPSIHSYLKSYIVDYFVPDDRLKIVFDSAAISIQAQSSTNRR